MINAGLSKGVFLLQSPAQLKMGQHLKFPHAPGPGLPGGPHPARRRRPGQRRVPVRGAVQAQRFLGIRPSSGGTGSGAGLRHHRVAGAGGAAHHGRGGVHGCPGR